MRLNLFFVFFVLNSFVLIAQEYTVPSARGENTPKIGKIKAVVFDKISNKPVEFATVALYKTKDSVLITGAIANEKGAFLLEQLSFGRYFLKINFIGYKQIVIDSIAIKPTIPEIDLGKIKLAQNAEVLKTVEVAADRGDMQIGIDRKVFNVEKSIVSEGGSASDVLQQVPSVNVDMDGNISLRGNGNVTVLIDGKPSGLTGSSRQAILQQIPASSIESIEVITNPSAKYDPDGMSGIINIVMKKNKISGFNGGVTAGVGTRDKYNGSANISYRNKKMNAYVNYGYRLNNRTMDGYSLRKNILSDTTFYLKESSASNRRNTSHNVKGGMEFYLNEKNTIGASLLFNTNIEKNPQNSIYEEFNNDYVFAGGYSRSTIENGNGNNLDYTLDYRKTFDKPKQELIFSGTYSDSKGKNISNYNEYDYLVKHDALNATPLQQEVKTTDKNNVATLQLDYTHPFKNQTKMELGAKSIIRNIDNDFYSQSFNYSENSLIEDTAINNNFIYNEKIHAVYSTLSGQIKKIAYQLGLRAEQAFTQSELITTNEIFKRDYFSLFPSVHLSKKLKKEQELQISYSRRINRPGTRSLNPFKDYSDPYNIRYGNPYLKPEYIDAYELGYIKYLKKTILSGSLYYRQTHDVMQRYKIIGDSTVSYVTQINLNSATSYGLEIIAKSELYKWWNITVSGNVFRNIINGKNVDADLNNENFSWTGKLISNMRVWKNMDIQFSANYTGPWLTAQGEVKQTFVMDLGLKKEIFKNASLSLNITDLSNARQMKIIASDNTFETNMYRKRESRVATITFSYSFGNLSEGSKRGKGNRNSGENMSGGEDMGM